MDIHSVSMPQGCMLPCGLHLAVCDSGTLKVWLAPVVTCCVKYTLGSKIVAGPCFSHYISVTQHCSRGRFLFKLLIRSSPSPSRDTSRGLEKGNGVVYTPGAEM